MGAKSNSKPIRRQRRILEVVTKRTLVLLMALAMSLVALRFRSELQAWAYGAGAPPAGHAAPELPPLETLDGAPLRLAELRGRVVLLHFWTFG